MPVTGAHAGVLRSRAGGADCVYGPPTPMVQVTCFGFGAQHLMDAERELRRLQQEHERARKEAIEALSQAGLSQRVMADAVGLSHQRINQLLHC